MPEIYVKQSIIKDFILDCSGDGSKETLSPWEKVIENWRHAEWVLLWETGVLEKLHILIN